MSGIGVISNPKARKNKRNTNRLRQLRVVQVLDDIDADHGIEVAGDAAERADVALAQIDALEFGLPPQVLHGGVQFLEVLPRGGVVDETASRSIVPLAKKVAEQDVAFVLRPPRMAQIAAVAAAGETMPQKSTYFHPKLPSGLVFKSLA